jgi:hypothetical protein
MLEGIMNKQLELLLPRCLQELVAEFGGYHRIPAEAWAQYDAALRACRAWLDTQHPRKWKSPKRRRKPRKINEDEYRDRSEVADEH